MVAAIAVMVIALEVVPEIALEVAIWVVQDAIMVVQVDASPHVLQDVSLALIKTSLKAIAQRYCLLCN